MNDLRSLQDMFSGTGDSSAPRKPKPLILADMLDADARSFETKQQAAAELRRLHEVNQMLVEALEITVPYLPAKTATLSEVEDALAKAKEQA